MKPTARLELAALRYSRNTQGFPERKSLTLCPIELGGLTINFKVYNIYPLTLWNVSFRRHRLDESIRITELGIYLCSDKEQFSNPF